VGPDFNWHVPRLGEGTAKYYYINDSEPGEDPNNKPIDDERQRAYFYQRADITSNLMAQAMVRYQSDAYVIRDFFETEYKQNVQPSTFVEVDQRWRNFSLNLLVQPRVNDFFETVERLPDVKLTGLRQQIGATPLYYESDSSIGYYHRKFADGSTNLPYAAFRADTFHQALLPQTFFNWLNVTPRVGGRYTHYGEANDSGATTMEEDRAVFNTGGEVSLKASRVWQDVHNRFWELDGLRHIVEPSINYTYVPRPNVQPHQLPQFDYQLPTTRLLPIEFPDYNSVDSIDSQSVMRFGLRNKLQTKRPEGIVNFLEWALYMDWRLRPHDQTTFSDIYSDMDLRPFSWLTFTSELRYDLDGKRWDEANHAITLTPNEVWSLTLGHRYLREFPGFGPESGNNLILGTIYYRFNENWAARISEHFEARDGVLEEQQYTLYRDFRSWTGALTLRIRDQRSGPTDVTAAVTFSLKAFPRFKLGEDVSKPSLLLGS
jgi:LPS-assembly protein